MGLGMRNFFANYVPDTGSGEAVNPYKKDVALIMGQSNIDGRNNNSLLPTDVMNPSTTVKHYVGGEWIDWDSTKPPVCFTYADQHSADTIMLNRLAADLGRTIYACKKSRGGTAFNMNTGGTGDWNVVSTESQDHYLPFMRRLANTKNYIEQVEGLIFNPVFLWMDIGESDSSIYGNGYTGDQFRIDFKAFVNAVRDFCGNPNLPIVHRKLQLDQGSVWQWFLDTQEAFAGGEINDYYLIRGNYTLQDTYHLDAASSQAYADTVLDLVKPWFV